LFDTRPTLSYQRLQTERPLSDQELYDRIRRTVLNKQDLQVLESFLIFNKYAFSATHHSAQLTSCRHVLKTNFYQPTKVALSFRLDPGFLPEVEYPTKPYGLFVIIGT
jgi:glutamate dehydrogenase